MKRAPERDRFIPVHAQKRWWRELPSGAVVETLLLRPITGGTWYFSKIFEPWGDWFPTWMPPVQPQGPTSCTRGLTHLNTLHCSDVQRKGISSCGLPLVLILLYQRGRENSWLLILPIWSVHRPQKRSSALLISVSSASFTESFAKWLFGCLGGRFRVLGDGVFWRLPGRDGLRPCLALYWKTWPVQ